MEITENFQKRIDLAPELLKIFATLSNATSFSKFMETLPNKDLVLNRTKKKIADLEEVKYDSQVSSAFDVRKANIFKLKWDIDRGTDATFHTKFFQNVIKNWDLEKLISSILSAREFGYAVFEYAWQKDDNFLIIKDVINKPCYWFEFDANNSLVFKSKATSKKKVCSRYNFLLVQNNPTYDNPYGESLLSKCYWSTTFKKGAKKFWAIFVEKYGMPFLVANVDSTDETLITSTLNQLTSLKIDGVGVFSKDDTVQVVSGSLQASSVIYNDFIKSQNEEISKVILGHSNALDTTSGELGSVSKAKTTIDIIARADKELVERTINNVITLIAEVNFGDLTNIPKFEMYEETDVDIDLANRDKILYDMGVTFSKDYFLNAYGFKKEDIEVGAKPVVNSMFSEQDEKMNSIVESLVDPFINLVEAGTSYDQIQEKLFSQFENIDDSKVEEIMSRLIQLAEAKSEQI